MSIQTEINRLVSSKANLKTAIENKGVTVPETAKLNEYPEFINSISGDSEKIGIFASDYVSDGILNISDIPIVSNSIVIFPKETITVNGNLIKNLKNITFILFGSTLNINDYFIEFSNCSNIYVYGGVINNAKNFALKYGNVNNLVIKNTYIYNTGKTSLEDTSAIQILGECDNFFIENCVIDKVSSGIISSDGFIHAYGIIINRLSSTNGYSRNGCIKNCTIKNVSGTDSGSTKADGDGIFIQAPPYEDIDGSINWRNDIKIDIENCIIQDCKKRAIKSACVGVNVNNCVIDGDFWYAGIDAQYGNMNISNTYIKNTSNYNLSLTSAVVATEGGLKMYNCFLSAPYSDDEFHPGIRFGKRLPASIITSDIPWDNVYIDNCIFDKVSRGVYGYVSDSTEPVPCRGIYITNCRFIEFSNRPVEFSDTLFNSLDTFVFTDWRIDYGTNRTQVKNKLSSFVYPISNNIKPNVTFELYSKHWTDEPMSGYDGLPTCPNAKIIYSGNNMGNIIYKEYTGHGSKIIGNKEPSTITSTLSKQLLYNSKIGDIYIDNVTGKVYTCTQSGTSSSIGTWTEK